MSEITIPPYHLRIELHDEYINLLSYEIHRTGIGPKELIQQADNLPEGLTAFEVNDWFINHSIAKLNHFLYVLEQWKQLPTADNK